MHLLGVNLASSFPALTSSFFFFPSVLSLDYRAMVGHDIPAPGAAVTPHPSGPLAFQAYLISNMENKTCLKLRFPRAISAEEMLYLLQGTQQGSLPPETVPGLGWGPRAPPFLGAPGAESLPGEPDGNICQGFCGCS